MNDTVNPAKMYESFGEKHFFTEMQIMAHELGHCMGVRDTPDPGHQMDNVVRWETPITKELGNRHPRTKY